MDPITIGMILAAVGALTYIGVRIVYVTLLSFDRLKIMFGKLLRRTKISRKDKLFIAKAVNTKQCSHVYGVINTKTGKIRDYEAINAENIEAEVQQKLKKTGTVLVT